MEQSFYVLIVFVVCFNVGSPLITRIQCDTSDKNTCVEPFCFFTKNETNAVFASYGCKELSKPLEQIYVHFKIYVKMFSQYFQLGYFPKFDYCEFIRNVTETNFLYPGVKFLQERMPESVRDCPYVDTQLQVNDLLLNDDDFGFLPAGKYKVICTLSDNADKKILRMITHMKI